MKLSNIFKKGTKSTIKSNIQPLDKNQLKKVIGGTGDSKTGKGAASDGLSASSSAN